MFRNLTIIAVASLVLALGCFAGVAALGGHDLAKNGWTLPMNWNIHVRDGDDRIVVTPGENLTVSGPTASRRIAWAGAQALQIDAPAQVTFTQGPQAGITVTGPQALIDRVVVEGGRIRLSGDAGGGGETPTLILGEHGMRVFGGDGERLRIDVTGPSVRAFTLNGGGDLDIRGYDQPDLALTINGSGDVDGQGRAGKLTLNIAGSGEADLSALPTGDSNIKLAGSGAAVLAASGAVDVDLAGSGDVTLQVRPASLSTSVAGSGEVHEDW